MRAYELTFGSARHPAFTGVYAHNGCFEPCNCPAYAHLHTWGIGKCYRPVAYCAECGQPCSPVRTTLAEVEGLRMVEEGRSLAAYMLEPYAASDCHLAPAYRDWRQTEICDLNQVSA